jgi:hypothetical protein
VASFLTTSKMHPALAARIQASVSGRRGSPRKPGASPLSARAVSLARVAFVLLVGFVVYSVVGVRRHTKQELTRARTAVLESARKESASLTDADRTYLPRTEAWLVNFSRSYDGEVIAGELRAPGALEAMLARPLVYVRGPIGGFSSSQRIVETASTSAKDALLLCLMEPPASRVEKVMLEKVRIAYGRGAVMEEHTPKARRLHEAEAGLPFLMPAWAERAKAAPELADVTKLQRDLERAPVAAAKQAARAGLLLVAMDEPGEGGGPIELDGERTHWVRLGLVDITSEKILLSTRRLVDPSWISLAKKSEYASGLDGCGLAFDVHEALRKK